MRLTFSPTNQIFFKKISNQTMRGLIEIRNPTSDSIFAFKIKCTNPDLFLVSPLKGTILPGQNVMVQFATIDPVSLDFAKQLVSNHKFLVEFVPIASQYAAPNFKSHETQRKKYYINMDNIRAGSRLFKDAQKMSMHSGISNKMSYISMKPQQKPLATNTYLTPHKIQPVPTFSNHDQLHQKYSRVKQQLDELHRQRQQIVNKMSSKNRTKMYINWKKIVTFVVFLIIGIFLGNLLELFLQNRREQLELEKLKKLEQEQQWKYFNIFDFLYDEVDAEQVQFGVHHIDP